MVSSSGTSWPMAENAVIPRIATVWNAGRKMFTMTDDIMMVEYLCC